MTVHRQKITRASHEVNLSQKNLILMPKLLEKPLKIKISEAIVGQIYTAVKLFPQDHSFSQLEKIMKSVASQNKACRIRIKVDCGVPSSIENPPTMHILGQKAGEKLDIIITDVPKKGLEFSFNSKPSEFGASLYDAGKDTADWYTSNFIKTASRIRNFGRTL